MGNSVRKLHFCSMCSKETQMKRIFYYGDIGAKSIIFRVAPIFYEIFFYEFDSGRGWQFLKYYVKTKDSTLKLCFRVESLAYCKSVINILTQET